jgi:uncharacterized protein (TIGR03437 family)
MFSRRAFLTAAALFALPLAQAADYYVAPSGSDSAPGTLAQPFQTIQKAASVMVAGDTAFIRAGTYRETVTPAHSGTQNAPITFMPYNGESVTVSGADAIPASSWTLSSGSIYKAPMSWDLGNGANQVFLDGQMMIEARWPNTTLDFSHPTVATASGGSYTNSGPGGAGSDGGVYNSTGTITDTNLPARPDGYWNGATIHALLGPSWWWQTGTVVGSTKNQLSFQFYLMGSTLVPSQGSSYYLSGEPGELDSAGEWFLAGSTLYFWTPATDNPAQHTVEAKRRQFSFNLSGRSFITVQGIGIFASSITSDATSQYLVLDGLTAQYLSQVSVDTEGGGPAHTTGFLLQGANSVLRNSTLAWSAGNGVLINGNGHRVFNNTIHDTGYGSVVETESVKSGYASSKGVIIGWNTIYNSSRAGIQTDPYANNYFIAGRIIHNDIHDYGLQTNDVGCTDTWTSNGGGTEIAYNLCHDGHGLLLKNSYPWVAGIYLDDNTSNFVVHHNVVWNTPWALQLKAANSGVYNNTFLGTITSFTPYGADNLPGTTIENNIFVGPITADPVGAVMTKNILPGTDPQFVDAAAYNFQLKPTSPAIGAGLAIPPYTNGYSGSAPDIGAYDHTKPPWKAGVQAAATVFNPSYAPTLTPGAVAVVNGSVPFDSGVSVLVTDGANVDLPAPLVYVAGTPPQVAFQVPSNAAPGVAVITITNGDGTISLSSAPLFAGAPPIVVTASQGSGQSTAINSSFATPLQATVKDAIGQPVPGAAVTFVSPATGAGGAFAASSTVTTDSTGVAVAPGFTANGFAGSYAVAASAAGAGALAVFNLTNIVPVPATVASGGIAGVGGSVPPVQAFSQNGLISIYGQGFLPAGVTGRRVLTSEYVNGGLPTVLLGVCVNVGGQRAAMLDVYPTQINAQVPAVTGPNATVSVLTYCGTPAQTASTPQTVAVSAASPEFLYFQLNANGTNPVVLVNAVTGALVGPSNILNGALTPAHVGDILTAYGTGFGALIPPVATGQIPQGTASAVGPVSVTIGGVALAASDILYAGAAPDSIIDQLNFRVPAGVAAGNQPIVIAIAGVSSPPHAFVAIQ